MKGSLAEGGAAPSSEQLQQPPCRPSLATRLAQLRRSPVRSICCRAPPSPSTAPGTAPTGRPHRALPSVVLSGPNNAGRMQAQPDLVGRACMDDKLARDDRRCDTASRGEARKLTQEDAADVVGVSVEFYARIERGKTSSSVPTLLRIAAAGLRLSSDVLLGLDRLSEAARARLVSIEAKPMLPPLARCSAASSARGLDVAPGEPPARTRSSSSPKRRLGRSGRRAYGRHWSPVNEARMAAEPRARAPRRRSAELLRVSIQRGRWAVAREHGNRARRAREGGALRRGRPGAYETGSGPDRVAGVCRGRAEQ